MIVMRLHFGQHLIQIGLLRSPTSGFLYDPSLITVVTLMP
jgi:hypothetical protein